jgi:hypothetical protein
MDCWKTRSLDTATFIDEMEHYDLWDHKKWPEGYILKENSTPLAILTFVKQFRPDLFT